MTRYTSFANLKTTGLVDSWALRADRDKAAVWGEAVVANRTHFPFNGFSSGSNTATNYRSAHWTKGESRVTGLKLVFCNSTLSASGEAVGNAEHTVKASIEYGGVTYPVYFGGTTRTKTLAVDEQVTSDPVYVTIPANTKFYVRTYVTVAVLGEKWPVAQSANTTEGEGFAATTDKTDDASYTTFSAASIYCPAAILGFARGEQPSVLIIGSSSGWGQGDTAEAPYWDFGYLSRGLRSAGYDYIKLTRASTTMDMFLNSPGHARQLQYLLRVRPTHIIQQLGSNDLSNGASVATMKSRLQDMWDILGCTGARIIQCTYTPRVTSSDSYATLAGQTVDSSNDERIEINEWIRGGAGGSELITGYLECCDAVESSKNSGKFKVNGTANAYTADGIHLTQLGHRETAASLTLETAIHR